MPKMTCDKCGKMSEDVSLKEAFDWLESHECDEEEEKVKVEDLTY